MLSLVEDILDLSKFQFDKFDLNYSWFGIDEVITEVFQMTEFQANLKNIQLEKENNIK